MNKPAEFEHGGNIHALLRDKGNAIREWLDFSANINPLGLAGSVRQAIEGGVEGLIHYPDPDAAELKQAISRRYGVPYGCITAGNGAVELLYVLCHCLKPRRVLVTAPTFSEYERAARAAGAATEYFTLEREQGFRLTVSDLLPWMNKVDMVFLCNPNNPTGDLTDRESLEPLLKAARANGVQVVVDESFQDFLPGQEAVTCRPLLARYGNLTIVHSLTKFYAIPGLRLGFVLASPEQTRMLHDAKDPWNVNSLAQAAGVAALADEKYRQDSRDMLEAVRRELYEALRALPGCRPFPPSVNYILTELSGCGATSGALRRRMAERGILIRDCANYPGLSSSFVRVAVKRREQNAALVAALRQELEKGFE